MKPFYIILTDTGERLELSDAFRYEPNDYEVIYEFTERLLGFDFAVLYPNESFCYRVDPFEDEPTTATTIAYQAYSEDGHLLCQSAESGIRLFL